LAGNSFGRIFSVTTWGESHGAALGATVDGCPPAIPLAPSDIQAELDRRKPGGAFSTPRKEKDSVEILSGVFQGLTTGTPISLIIYNRDVRSSDYKEISQLYRPGHADRTYEQKYGLRDWRGGGRSSARETAARGAAGAIAKKFLNNSGIYVQAFTLALAGVECKTHDPDEINRNSLYCPDSDAAQKMLARLKEIKADGDSAGGIVEIHARGCPPGLGEPVFDKLDARLAAAIMSVGAVKGVEIGEGFRSASMLGSENNDPIIENGYETNHAGGILGGISTGQNIVIRAAVKPIPSISREQRTVDSTGRTSLMSIKGRHDVSAIPRIIPVLEAMTMLVLADFMLHPTFAGR